MEQVRFSQLYKIPSGNGLSRPSAVRGVGYKMVGMGELFANDIINDMPMDRVQMSDKELIKYTLEPDDLLFARQSLVAEGAGKCSIVKSLAETTTYESHLIRVRLNEKIANPWYYFYLFKLPSNPIKSIINQCAQAGIRGKELEKVKLPLPDINTQNNTVKVLSKYDELIELNNKRIKLLEQTAEELYKEWFVRFRFPNYQNTEFENGIPKGWSLETVGKICKIKSGFAYKSEWWTDNGTPVIKIKDIQENTIDTTDLSFVSFEHSESAKDFYVEPGDLLIAMTGATIGKIALVPYNQTKLSVNQRVGKFFFGENPISKVGFLYCFIQQDWVQDKIEMVSGSSAAQPNISGSDLENIKLLYNETIINEFNNAVAPLIKELLLLQLKNKNLIKQRDLLLPRLMSGKLEVK